MQGSVLSSLLVLHITHGNFWPCMENRIVISDSTSPHSRNDLCSVIMARCTRYKYEDISTRL